MSERRSAETPDEIREAVKREYGRVAQQSVNICGSGSPDETARRVGYSDELLENVTSVHVEAIKGELT